MALLLKDGTLYWRGRIYGANANMTGVKAAKRSAFITDRSKILAAKSRKEQELLDRIEKRKQLAEMRRHG